MDVCDEIINIKRIEIPRRNRIYKHPPVVTFFLNTVRYTICKRTSRTIGTIYKLRIRKY